MNEENKEIRKYKKTTKKGGARNERNNGKR